MMFTPRLWNVTANQLQLVVRDPSKVHRQVNGNNTSPSHDVDVTHRLL